MTHHDPENVLRNVLPRKWWLQPFAWCTTYRVAVARVKLVPPVGVEPTTHGLRILTQGEPGQRGVARKSSGYGRLRAVADPARPVPERSLWGQNVLRNVLRPPARGRAWYLGTVPAYLRGRAA